MDNCAKITKTARCLLYCIPALPFIVWANFSFPYVTIRTSVFRIIVEAVLALLLILVIKNKMRVFGIRRNYFFIIFGCLLIVELASAFFGESFIFSFFGDLERMWGIITVLHLFLFYILLRSFFGQEQWRIFFHVSFATSILVSVYGIIQHFPEDFGIRLFEAGASRIPSTLGNPTYVASYLILNIGFALYYLTRAKGRIKYFYIVTIIVCFYAFSLTDIRGAYLGFLSALAFALISYIIIGKRKKIRIASTCLAVVGLIVLVSIFMYPNSQLVKRTPVLNRLSSISLSDSTTRTRFMAWNAAWQGFLERPFLGVGMENFDIVFNKYFPAEYYNIARTETYFDRAHNQFLNVLAESGIFAFLFYIGLFAVIGYYLVFGYRKRIFSLPEFLIFSGLAIAYSVHLFFVFEDINSQILFMSLLGLIEHQFYDKKLLQSLAERQKTTGWIVVMSVIVAVFAIYAAFEINFKTLRAARTTADAYYADNIPKKAIDFYQKSLSYNLFASENITINYTDYLISLADNRELIIASEPEYGQVLRALDDAKLWMAREIEKKPNSSFLHMKLGHLNVVHNLFDDNVEHLAEAIKHLEKANELSPERLQIHYILGEAYVLAGQPKEAMEIMRQAIEINPEFGSSYYFFGRAYLADGQVDKAYDLMITKAFFEVEHQHVVNDPTLLFALSEKLAEKGDYEKVVEVYKRILDISDYSPKAPVSAALAAAYIQINEFELAIEAAQKAAEFDPEFIKEAEFFIQMINDGKIDELKEVTR